MISLIFRPCDYLRITWVSGSSSKKAFDWGYPTLGAVLVTALMVYLAANFVVTPCAPSDVECKQINPAIFFNSNAFGLVTGFLQTMPGFFVAALAAIATFNNPAMDSAMLGNPPRDANNNAMTRRRFLSQAFAYLTFLSLCLFFVTTMIKFGYEVGLMPVGDFVFYGAYGVAVFLITLFLIQMLFITFMCLYYLGDRIHTP